MHLLLFAVILGVSYGARLENTYLPPGYAAAAAGNGQFLSAPKHSNPASNSFRNHERIPIFKYTNDIFNGQYKYEYETGNGISAREEGRLNDQHDREVHGSYSYTSPDGQIVTVEYLADADGFRPIGSHIPGIPAAIQKSLEFNARQDVEGVVDDGSYRSENRPDQEYLPAVADAKRFIHRPQNFAPPPKPINTYLAPKAQVHRFVPARHHPDRY